MMSAMWAYLFGEYEDDSACAADNTSEGEMSGPKIVSLLTSLCKTDNSAIPVEGKVVYGLEGAEIRKEKSNKRHFNGNVGRVYLHSTPSDNNSYSVGWVLDNAFHDCMVCAEPFGVLSRSRHHCRCCGSLVCDECSSNRARIAQLSKGTMLCRVCDICDAKHPADKVWNLNSSKQ